MRASHRVPSVSRAALAIALAGCFAVLPTAALAHAGEDITRGTWPRAWTWEPAIVTALFVSAALYVLGLRAVRGSTRVPQKLRSEAFYFFSGWVLVVVALLSPLHPLGQVLFSAHMVQHELLMVAAAPLLILGRPGLVWLYAIPRPDARRLAGIWHDWAGRNSFRWLGHPLTAWMAHALALWIWHAPRLFEATLDNDFVHALQHASFLGTALWFWQAVFHGPRRRAGYGLAVAYLFTTALHTGALGALITFAGTTWYPRYAASTADWGLSPLEDQQLGGVIMWVPAGLTYVIAALALFAAWIREPEDVVSHRLSGKPFNPPPKCAPSP